MPQACLCLRLLKRHLDNALNDMLYIGSVTSSLTVAVDNIVGVFQLKPLLSSPLLSQSSIGKCKMT